MRFRFSLQVALDRAAARERTLRLALAAVVQAQAALRSRLAELDGAPLELLRILDDGRAGRRLQLEAAARDVQRARDAYLSGAREHRALETLRARHKAAFDASCERAEERELDEQNRVSRTL